MLSPKDLLSHIGTELKAIEHHLHEWQEGGFLCLNIYGKVTGMIYNDGRSLPLEAKQQSANLIIADSDWIEFWAGGKIAAQLEWEANEAIEKLLKKFIKNAEAQTTSFAKAFTKIIRLQQKELLENCLANIPVSLKFHQVSKQLIEYARKHLNPQAINKDIWRLSIEHFYLYETFKSHPNASFFHSDWIASQFGELVAIWQETVQFPILTENPDLHSLLSKSDFSQSEEEKDRNYFYIGQLIQKAFKSNYQTQGFTQTDYMKDAFSIATENTLALNHLGGTSIHALLANYYLAKLNGGKSFWAYPLHQFSFEETKDTLFSAHPAEQQITKLKQSNFDWIIADLSKPIARESFERGYQQITPTKIPEALARKVHAPKGNSNLDWLFWLVENTPANSNLAMYFPMELAFADHFFKLRKWLEDQFTSIEVLHSKDRPSISLALKGKLTAKEHYLAESTSQNYTSDKVSLFRFEDFLPDGKKQNTVEPHAHYWLPKSDYLSFTPLFKLPFSNEKEPIFLSEKMNLEDWLEQKSVDKTQINEKVIDEFKKHYAKELEMPEAISILPIRENLQKTIKFSKQLPVLHKLSLRLYELLPKDKSAGLSFDLADEFIQHIEQYLLKISQLSKGANERRAMFANMKGFLESIKKHIQEYQQKLVWTSEKLEQINAESILCYAYSVLQSSAYQKEYEHWLNIPTLTPRLPLLPNFWDFAQTAKQSLFKKIEQGQGTHS